MKKYFAIILCVITLLAIGTVAASAEVTEEAGFWVENAKNIEEILAGEAGERDTAWEVPFLHITPTVDGTIDKNEYMPFEMYEDYISWMANSDTDDGSVVYNSIEEFNEFYDSTQDFFDAYWGWDGTYLYVAFEVDCINGFKCTPEDMGGDVFLFAYNCLQVGIASVDAQHKDPSYVELGFGTHSETNDPITFNWSGNYCPTAGEDFKGYYDAENQRLVYEARIHLQSALGLTDRTVQNGDQMNYAWLLSVNGETTSASDTWQVAFCHGIGGPYSGKENQYFARVTFAGMPEGTDIPVVEIPGMSEDDKEYGLIEMIDLSNESVVNSFEGINAAVEYVTEGEESFMRITALSADDLPAVYSTKYPKNLLAAWTSYVVVKYRTSFEDGEDLGIIFRNTVFPEHDIENCYSELIGTDGEWHTVLFYMTEDSKWQHYILNLGLVPFVYADNPAQQTIDIAYIKCYQNDPYDLIESEMYDPNASEETEADTVAGGDVTEAVTQAPAETSASTSAENVTGGDTAASGNETTGGDDEKGCASSVGMGALALCLAGAAFLVKKKKED